MPELHSLLAAVQPLQRQGDEATPIAGVSYDSRQVRPGDLFVASRGQRHDGHQFVADALLRGAGAVLVEDPAALPAGVPGAVVASGRLALAQAAAALHGFPARRLRLVGVTGTDGKTTTCYLTAAVLEAAGYRVGVVSTVDVRIGGLTFRNPTSHTTPQAPELQALLARMVAAGCDYAVVEVSSHALALDRVAGCDFDVAVFTNLTPEHLDFHGSLAEYRRAKGRLFEMLGDGPDKGAPRAGVVNADDPSAIHLAGVCRALVVRYGLTAPADVSAHSLALDAEGSRFRVAGPFAALGGELEIETSLAGRHNVANWLAAIAAGLTQGASAADVAAAAAAARPVPGRLQRVEAGQPFAVVVDFAHTPNALARALEALRPGTRGRLIVVFGHAGGRDTRNRPALGQVAGELADLTVLTADDPYDEAPEEIAAEIAVGLARAGRRPGVDYHLVPDRRAAFALALSLARPGDTVLLAGRGHEQQTVVRGRRLPFDDVAVARELLQREAPGQPKAA